MAELVAPSGQVVALEGHPEIISTQLRLLPMSPRILVLPTIESYLSTDAERDFNVTKYIKQTHDAVKVRNEAARTFLQGSSGKAKRIVFLNGGTPSAQSLCIRAIMKHETNGDDKRAEELFDQVAKHGVSGLNQPYQAAGLITEIPDTANLPTQSEQLESSEKDEDRKKKLPQTEHQETKLPEQSESYPSRQPREDEDPITRAMRAADALDTETADLQPSNELDLTIPSADQLSTTQQSNGLPLHQHADNTAGVAAPFYVFGAQQRDDFETIVEEDVDAEAEVKQQQEAEDRYMAPSPKFAITHFEKTPDQVVYPGLSDIFPLPNSPSCFGESQNRSALLTPVLPELYTPSSDVSGIKSPGEVVFGEASLLDMRLQAHRPSLTRVRSLDRVYPSSPRPADELLLGNAPLSPRPKSIMVITDDNDSPGARLDYIDGPRTIVVKSKRDAAITMTPVPVSKKRKRATYVDRGTDAEEVLPVAREPFEPVFRLTEDLIIHLKDESPDPLLERCIVAFREARYPLGEFEAEDEKAREIIEHRPSTPDSRSADGSKMGLDEKKVDEGVEKGKAGATGDDVEAPPDMAEVTVQASPSADEYDPFAYVQPVKVAVKALPKQAAATPKPASTVRFEQPPTPEKTPTPSISEKRAEKEDKFHEFSIRSSQTAVAVQNALRSILSTYFPPDASNHHHFQFSFLPELDGLWNPVFREQEPGSPPKKIDRKLDQVIAMGSQNGVPKEYSSLIVGQLEKLGDKPSGLSRSGRLDFRYLLANAIQAFITTSLSGQSDDYYLGDHHLLATLILPHLETYLALHPDVRYLVLEYPPEHLGTILALQRLVGVDLLKVAQIVDSKSKDLPFSDMRGTAVTRTLTGSLKDGSLHGSGEVSVAKANFILTSAATDAEIADFVTTVWKILNSVSDLYRPDRPETPEKRVSEVAVEKQLEKVVEDDDAAEKVAEKPVEKPAEKEKKRPPPLTSSFSPFPKITEGPKSPMSPNPGAPPMNLPPQTPTGPPADPPSRPGSIAETTRTFKSFRSKHSKGLPRKRPAADGKDAMSVYTFNPEEDSDYDDEERRLMPIFLQKRQVRKGNSRKALKFLGLA